MVVSQVFHNSKYIASKLTNYVYFKQKDSSHCHRLGPSSCVVVPLLLLYCPALSPPVFPSSRWLIISSHWAFLFVCFAFPSWFAPCPLVVLSPSCLDVALSFRLVWWRHCHCLAILQLYPFPPCEQLLAAVGPGAGWWVPSLPCCCPPSLLCHRIVFVAPCHPVVVVVNS